MLMTSYFPFHKRLLGMLATAFLALTASADGAIVLRIEGDDECRENANSPTSFFAQLEDSTSEESANPGEKDNLSSPMNGGGTSSSTSSSGSSAGSSSSASVISHAVSAPDLDLIGWIGGEARFSLPNPPGTDLLRPPQV